MSKKWPGTDSGELDFPSPTEAGHNKDGMYTMREPKPGEYDESKEVKLESGIYIQKPDMKEYRILWLDTISGHFQIECDESPEQIKDILASAARQEAQWYNFTDPTYGHINEFPVAALQHPICIVSQWRDLEELEEQIKKVKMQKRINNLGGASKQQVNEILRRN